LPEIIPDHAVDTVGHPNPDFPYCPSEKEKKQMKENTPKVVLPKA
jgi:hypothetical protein